MNLPRNRIPGFLNRFRHHFFSFCLLFLLTATVATLSTAESVSTNPEKMTTAQIGAEVERVLVNAPYLHMIARSTEGAAAVCYESHMTPDRYKSVVFENGELILSWSWMNGRVSEYRPKMEKRPILERDAAEPDGAANSVFKTELDCLFGSATQTWVGAKAGKPSYFRRQIDASERHPDARVDGHLSFVCSYEYPFGKTRAGEDNVVRQTFYVDQQSFLVRRWETLNQGSLRIRTYNISLGQVPENVSWTISAGEERTLHAPHPPEGRVN